LNIEASSAPSRLGINFQIESAQQLAKTTLDRANSKFKSLERHAPILISRDTTNTSNLNPLSRCSHSAPRERYNRAEPT
jgi:hypothetical protein